MTNDVVADPHISSLLRAPPASCVIRSRVCFLTGGRLGIYPGLPSRGSGTVTRGGAQSWPPAQGPAPGLTKEMQEHCFEEAERQFSGGGNKHLCIPANQLPDVFMPLSLICTGSALLLVYGGEIPVIRVNALVPPLVFQTQTRQHWLDERPATLPAPQPVGRGQACSEPRGQSAPQ